MINFISPLQSPSPCNNSPRDMSVLNILTFPDPRLRTKALPVEEVDDEIRRLTEDMLETMYEEQGIGLAATQVDVHKQVIVMDVSDERNEPRIFINPKVTIEGDEQVETQEGCLSVPGFYEEVERAEKISVEALDQDGKSFILQAEGILAVCLQHELDHLNGKLFIDYLSGMKRQRIREKLTKSSKDK